MTAAAYWFPLSSFLLRKRPIYLRTPVTETTDLGTIIDHLLGIKSGDQFSVDLTAFSKHFATGRQQQTHTEKIQLALNAATVGRDQKQLVLHGTRPQQGSPMLLARLGPLCRQADNLGSFERHLAEKLGKAQVIADCDSETADRCWHNQRFVARAEKTILAH